MRKIITIAIAAIMTMALGACGGDGGNSISAKDLATKANEVMVKKDLKVTVTCDEGAKIDPAVYETYVTCTGRFSNGTTKDVELGIYDWNPQTHEYNLSVNLHP